MFYDIKLFKFLLFFVKYWFASLYYKKFFSQAQYFEIQQLIIIQTIQLDSFH